MPIVHPVSFSSAVAGLYWILRIVERTERNRPDEVGRRRRLRQSSHALEDRRLTCKAPVPVGLDRSKRRTIIVEPGAGGRTAGVVPGRAAMAGNARRLIDEAILGYGIAETNIKTGSIRKIGLRSLQTIIGKHGIPIGG